MFASRMIRRFSLTTVAGMGAFLAGAAEAQAQGKASEAAVVRVEVVAAPAAPEVRSAGAGWAVTEAGDAKWTAAVAVGRDAAISLLGGGGDERVRASLAITRDGDERIARVEVVADPVLVGVPAAAPGGDAGVAPAELPVTLRIEH